MKVVDLMQGSNAWLDWRSVGVTATDAVILLGLSPYKTTWRLWAEKTGYAVPEDLSANPNVRRGVLYEDVARKAYEDKHDELLLAICCESLSIPILRASLDGIDSNGRPVELKCPASSTWDEVVAKREKSEAYLLYLPQVMHQIIVTGADYGWLVFYNVDTAEMIEFQIHKDDEMCQEIIAAAGVFWGLVQNKKEPKKDPERDVFIPEGGVANDWISVAENYRFFEAEIQEFKARIKELEEKQKPYLEEMKGLMGDYYSADYCGVMVTRYVTSGRINYQKIIEDKTSLTEDEVEQYRGAASERCRVTVTDSLKPKGIVQQEVVEPLENCQAVIESAYF